jgi:hypothetical protein
LLFQLPNEHGKSVQVRSDRSCTSIREYVERAVRSSKIDLDWLVNMLIKIRRCVDYQTLKTSQNYGIGVFSKRRDIWIFSDEIQPQGNQQQSFIKKSPDIKWYLQLPVLVFGSQVRRIFIFPCKPAHLCLLVGDWELGQGLTVCCNFVGVVL